MKIGFLESRNNISYVEFKDFFSRFSCIKKIEFNSACELSCINESTFLFDSIKTDMHEITTIIAIGRVSFFNKDVFISIRIGFKVLEFDNNL